MHFSFCTGDSCKYEWQKLRAQYMGYRRKLINPSGKAFGVEPYFRHSGGMQFLKDCVHIQEE